MRVGGVVLCGGKSSRMGFAKARLPFGAETMLERVVRILRQVVEPIVVVAARDQQLPPIEGVTVAYDERPERGPLEGILAGLRALADRADEVGAAYVTSCDVPLLRTAFVESLISHLPNCDAVVPVETRFQHPLAAVYRTSVIDIVSELLDADQLRPVFLFDRVPTCRINVEELRVADPELDTLANLNQPSDYFTALAKAGFEPAEGVRKMFEPAD